MKDVWNLFSGLEFHPVLAQTDQVLPNIWQNVSAEPGTLLTILGTLMAIVLAIIVGSYKYQRWKKYKIFEAEMKALDLDPQAEGTFAWMVKRYAMDEPVNVLYSARLFDEMASSEIFRVLSSSASAKTKSHFIDTVYGIRTRTYHPEWMNSDDGLSPKLSTPLLTLEKP